MRFIPSFLFYPLDNGGGYYCIIVYGNCLRAVSEKLYRGGNMNKYLKAFIDANRLTCEKGVGFYGKVKGFQVRGDTSALAAPPSVAFYAHLSEEGMARTDAWLHSNTATYGIASFNVTKIGFTCVFNALMGTWKRVAALLEQAPVFLAEVSAPDTCPFCGEPIGEEVRYFGVNGGKFAAHERCFDAYCDEVAQKEGEEKAKPDNTARGIVGAIIGSLVGCLVWGALYFIGYLAVVAAILVAFGAAFAWDKLGGKNNKIKIISVWVVTLVMITVTMLVVYLIDVNIALNEVGVEGSAFEWFITLLAEDEDFMRAVLIDTIVSYIFIAVADILITARILQTQKREGKSLKKY